ncbi:MAG TPA: hypothetical protein VJK51_04665 [Candidatus Nanoarchaeia archaeon]|nr:hypothetical protein [Candidatus Nanoarchaeia archaeon]
MDEISQQPLETKKDTRDPFNVYHMFKTLYSIPNQTKFLEQLAEREYENALNTINTFPRPMHIDTPAESNKAYIQAKMEAHILLSRAIIKELGKYREIGKPEEIEEGLEELGEYKELGELEDLKEKLSREQALETLISEV